MPVSINDAQRKDAAERVAANQGQPSANQGFSSAEPPQAPKGLSTPLHPGGTRPGGGRPPAPARWARVGARTPTSRPAPSRARNAEPAF